MSVKMTFSPENITLIFVLLDRISRSEPILEQEIAKFKSISWTGHPEVGIFDSQYDNEFKEYLQIIYLCTAANDDPHFASAYPSVGTAITKILEYRAKYSPLSGDYVDDIILNIPSSVLLVLEANPTYQENIQRLFTFRALLNAPPTKSPAS